MKMLQLFTSYFCKMFVITLLAAPVLFAALAVADLKCEYKTNPLGMDVIKPRLSWILTTDKRGILQSAYEVRAAATPKDVQAGKNLLWSTGKVASEQSAHIVYGGPVLLSRQRVYWQVRVWDNRGTKSAWSEPAFWEMGLLSPSDWKAEWIQANLTEDPKKSGPANVLRREFTLAKEIAGARVYVTSHGLYEMELNGTRVGRQVLTPGWTSYHNRLQYQTYDVTFLLKTGKNAVGVSLGDGWYRGNLAWENNRNVYGDKLALLAQIEVTYKDGTRELIVTDGDWKSSTGPILMSDIYNGETYDARLEQKGWSSAGFNDSAWQGVTVVDASKEVLVAPLGPAIVKVEEIKPVKIFKTPAGETVVDMGQNMVGWLRLNVQGPAGTTVTLVHAEVLDKAGNFYTENLRTAKQQIQYTLKGGGPEVYEPHFTFQGFRFVKVENWPGELTANSLTGVVVHSDMAKTGDFSCSNEMINQLQHNIQWGQKGNFVDVPTDCPQRDERLGWTGDAQAFARTACFNHDVAAFYTKWLKDVAADQKASGSVPNVNPNIFDMNKPEGGGASAGWADAAVIVPWTVYLCYGDTRILEQQYASMKGWVDYMANRAGDSYFWNTDYTFGDWLSFNSTSSDYPGATTDKDFITQAYFIHSTELLCRTAQILGKTDDVTKYTAIVEKAKAVFMREFVTPSGRLSPNTQTAYALALGFDILPADVATKAAERLVEDVRKFGHITTGFLGTPLICHVLSDYGYYNEAFMLLNRKEYPSWLYPITQGATTIWERWDGQKPDGSFQDKGMNSFNHYAYGAIGEWLYRVVAGLEIDPAQPGYKHIIIQPHPGGGLTSAQASTETMYGPAASLWKIVDGVMHAHVTIPVNTTATIRLPKATLAAVIENDRPLAKTNGIGDFRQDGDTVVVSVGSGEYKFAYAMK